MRLTRITLSVTVILFATATLRAQMAHSEVVPACECQACQACPGCNECGSCGALLPGITHALGSILPFGPGSDARHKCYKAALRRSTFDKKVLLPIPYYPHIVPLWSHKRCCVSARMGCPTCGPQGAMVEEYMDMSEVPEGMPMEPTPAAQPDLPVVPDDVVPFNRSTQSAAAAPCSNSLAGDVASSHRETFRELQTPGSPAERRSRCAAEGYTRFNGHHRHIPQPILFLRPDIANRCRTGGASGQCGP